MQVDYKVLLAKYIEFVGDEEGTTFLARIRPDGRGESSNVQFSPAEVRALEECSTLSH